MIKIKRKKYNNFTERDYKKGALFDTDGVREKEETVESLDEDWVLEQMDGFFNISDKDID